MAIRPSSSKITKTALPTGRPRLLATLAPSPLGDPTDGFFCVLILK